MRERVLELIEEFSSNENGLQEFHAACIGVRQELDLIKEQVRQFLAGEERRILDLMNSAIERGCEIELLRWLAKEVENRAELFQCLIKEIKRSITQVKKDGDSNTSSENEFEVTTSFLEEKVTSLLKEGDGTILKMLKYLISQGTFDVNSPVDEEGNSLLHIAVEYKCFSLLDYLLTTKNINPLQKNNNEKTALDIARESLSEVTNERLKKEYGSSKDNVYVATEEMGEQAKEEICGLKKKEKDYEEIISSIVNTKYCNGEQSSLIKLAAIKGDLELTKYLIKERKVSPGIGDKYRHSPLFFATLEQRKQIVEYLVSIYSYSLIEKRKSLLVAAARGNIDIYRAILLNTDIRLLNVRDNISPTALECSIVNKKRDFFEHLLKERNINFYNPDITIKKILLEIQQDIEKMNDIAQHNPYLVGQYGSIFYKGIQEIEEYQLSTDIKTPLYIAIEELYKSIDKVRKKTNEKRESSKKDNYNNDYENTIKKYCDDTNDCLYFASSLLRHNKLKLPLERDAIKLIIEKSLFKDSEIILKKQKSLENYNERAFIINSAVIVAVIGVFVYFTVVNKTIFPLFSNDMKINYNFCYLAIFSFTFICMTLIISFGVKKYKDSNLRECLIKNLKEYVKTGKMQSNSNRDVGDKKPESGGLNTNNQTNPFISDDINYRDSSSAKFLCQNDNNSTTDKDQNNDNGINNDSINGFCESVSPRSCVGIDQIVQVSNAVKCYKI